MTAWTRSQSWCVLLCLYSAAPAAVASLRYFTPPPDGTWQLVCISAADDLMLFSSCVAPRRLTRTEVQQSVKTRLIVPFIRYTEHQMAGCSRMTKVPLALVCRAVFHLTIYHSSSVCVQSVTSPAHSAETWSFSLSPHNAASSAAAQ